MCSYYFCFVSVYAIFFSSSVFVKTLLNLYRKIKNSIIGKSFYVLKRLAPESPRWLLSKGRVSEATKIMRKLGKVNGAEIKETFNLENVKTDMVSSF